MWPLPNTTDRGGREPTLSTKTREDLRPLSSSTKPLCDTLNPESVDERPPGTHWGWLSRGYGNLGPKSPRFSRSRPTTDRPRHVTRVTLYCRTRDTAPRPLRTVGSPNTRRHSSGPTSFHCLTRIRVPSVFLQTLVGPVSKFHSDSGTPTTDL